MPMATISDVALYAGVSPTTVSRVLNKKGYISKSTYEKVYRAIQELDFIPNQIARSLYKQRSWYISLIVPDSSNPFWAEITHFIEIKLYEKGYKLFLCNTSDNANRERDYIRMMRQNMVDGIILGTHMLEMEEYQNLSLPVVAFDLILGEHIPTICSDHKKGGRLAAEELLQSNCHCVLNIRAVLSKHTPSLTRHTVVDQVLSEHGIRVINYDLDIRAGIPDYPGIVRTLFEQHPEIDSIFSEDIIVANAVKYVQEKGMSIPGDFKAVSYDGTFITNLCFPSITCVEQPIEELASMLVDVLLRKIDGEEIHGSIILPNVRLRKGQTT